jgi:hypothetical protein
MLEQSFAMDYLLSFPLYSLRLPLLLIEQVLNIDGKLHLDATRDLGGTNASRIAIGTLRKWRRIPAVATADNREIPDAVRHAMT